VREEKRVVAGPAAKKFVVKRSAVNRGRPVVAVLAAMHQNAVKTIKSVAVHRAQNVVEAPAAHPRKNAVLIVA